MNVADARRFESCAELGGVEGLDVGCRELRELEPAESGGDVPPDLQLIVMVRAEAQVALCGVLQPARHVLGDSHVLVVENDK